MKTKFPSNRLSARRDRTAGEKTEKTVTYKKKNTPRQMVGIVQFRIKITAEYKH